MITKVGPKIKNVLVYGTRDQRKHICKKEFAYFCLYYFSEYFEYKCAPFHWDLFEDCKKMASLEIDEAIWAIFREGAKSSIGKMYVCYLICFKLRHYINWDSQDKSNAEQALFDVATSLRSNKRILNDFGNLYGHKSGKDNKNTETEMEEPAMKRIGSFITRNGIKVEAFSTQQSTRGRIYKKYRPDQYIFDDFENSITKESLPMTMKIIRHIDEARAGLASYGSMLYLCNYITEEGSVAHLMELLKGKPKKVVRNIPVVAKGIIAWPDKYVFTGAEADRENRTLPKELMKIALDRKKENLTEKVYNTEMLNNPEKSGDYFFDRIKVRAAMEKAREATKEVALLKTWENFDPRHRYGLGADTAEGIGADSSTITVINFSTTPNRVVATYKNNEVPPNTFAHEIVRAAQLFGECFVLPEINNTGYGTIAELLTLKYYNMYVREVKNKTNDRMMKEWGYKTTEGNKYEVASQFKTAFEDGTLEILDEALLNEMYHYTKQELRTMSKDANQTHHFDLLKSAFFAWEARLHATLSKADKATMYKAPKREAYQG